MAVNGTFSFLASDGLASANVALTSGTAGLTAAVMYGPYGSSRYSSGTMPMDYGFTGQHQDATSGLSYFNARYYDPVAGQFITPDTILPGNGFDILGLSRYAYVEGNPESRTDPTGRCPWCIGAVIGAVVGAGIAYGAQVVGNLQHNQGWGSFTHVDVQQIGKAAMVGFVVGLTGGAAAGWLVASGVGTVATAAGTVGIGAGEGVLGQIGDNLLHGRAWHQDLAQAALFGGATAGVGGAAAVGARQLVKRLANKVINDGPVAEASPQRAPGAGVSLASPADLPRAAGSHVRPVGDDETLQSVLEKMSALQFDTGAEYALVTLKGGGRAIIGGGEGGITNLEDLGVENIIAHTHPHYDINGMNPSADDLAALEALGQQQSLIYWRGDVYQFGRGHPE